MRHKQLSTADLRYAVHMHGLTQTMRYSLRRELDWGAVIANVNKSLAELDAADLVGGLTVVIHSIAEALYNDGHSDTDFAISVGRAWLRNSAYVLLISEKMRRTIGALISSGADESEIEPALRYGLIERMRGEPYEKGAREGRSLQRVFLSTAMARVSSEEIKELSLLAQRIEWIMGGKGVYTFAPILLRDPRRGLGVSNHDGLLALDEAMLAESDLVLLVTEPTAHGVGIMARMALEFQVAHLIIRGGLPSKLSQISPNDRPAAPTAEIMSTMLLDSPGELINVVDARDAGFWPALEALIEEIDLPQRRSMRMRRYELARAKVARVVDQLERMSQYELDSLDPIFEIEVDRWDFLISHPLNFIAAVGHERDAIEHLCPLHTSTLTDSEWRSLTIAERRGGWSPARSRDLVDYFLRQQARQVALPGDRQRTDSDLPTFWLDLDSKLSER